MAYGREKATINLPDNTEIRLEWPLRIAEQTHRHRIEIILPPEFDIITLNRRAVGGNARVLGGIELIFPTPFAPESRSVRTSVFVDVGNVWDTKFAKDVFASLQPEEYAKIPDYSDPSSFRMSAGFSVQWISPMGPLIFTLSKALQQEDQDETETFSFNIGRTF